MEHTHQDYMKIVDSLVQRKLKNEPIVAVILVGSVARGDETEYSDIDIIFYVKKKNLPKDLWRFYKFKGKYIEEHYSAIEELKNENILPDEVILYDKTGKINGTKFNKSAAKNKFIQELKKAKRSQKLAENLFRKNKYEESFYYLYGLRSPVFTIMHALPPRYNLPFPSFRLLKSLEIIDKRNKTHLYKLIEHIYSFNNKDQNDILWNFKKSYILMSKLKRVENPKSKNLGFFDKTKIKYNIDGLKKTFEKYPFVYAYRFVVGCLTMSAFDKNIGTDDKKLFYRYLLNSLGITTIDEKLVKQKIELSRALVKECEKLC
ncbi:MAG: nucleotidyltransferase domain-containing protein [Candidatus Aenigmatarchaeota archaeon]